MKRGRITLPMTRKSWLKGTSAVLGVTAMLSNSTAAFAQGLSQQQKLALLRANVKYVFVVFHENESFDHYFGTFPGANGLFSAPAGTPAGNQTASFVQNYLDTNVAVTQVQPFLMPQAVRTTQSGTAGPAGTVVPIYPYDYISVDHGHQGMSTSLHVVNGVARNDLYAIDQEGFTMDANGTIVKSNGAAVTAVSLAAKQKAEADLSHIDCDTIPSCGSWAKNFVLFDNFHQSIVGPSTPNAIAIIAGQSGQTQWALHPEQGATVTYADPAAFHEPSVRATASASRHHQRGQQRVRPGGERSGSAPGLEQRLQRREAAVQRGRELRPTRPT